MSETSSREGRPGLTLGKWWARSGPRLKLFVGRGFFFSIAVLGIYVLVGSCIFPLWWYELAWGEDPKLIYVIEGLGILADQYFPLAMATLIAFTLAVVSIFVFKQRILPLVDRFGGIIAFCFLMAIMGDAVVLYHTQRSAGLSLFQLAQAMQTLENAIRNEHAASAPPTIEPPVYFYYLNTAQVEALYSQVQPELQEKERVVSGSTSVKGKAGLSPGPLGLEIEGARGNESKSTFARTDSSPERRCLLVMQYVRQNHPEKYYTSWGVWFSTNLLAEFDLQRKASVGRPIDLSKIPYEAPFGSTGPDKGGDAAQQKVKKWAEELKNELRTLKGLVFVDGAFGVSQQGEEVVLTEEFCKQPFHVAFRARVPKKSIEPPLLGKSLRLRVFGNVLVPMQENGLVEIRAIAVF